MPPPDERNSVARARRPLRILALTRYSPRAASTRQRFVQYAPALAEAGIELVLSPLLNDDYVAGLVTGERPSPLAIAGSYLHRLQAIAGARRFDIIWLHYEAFPYLPGLFERLPLLAGRPLVYDADDAFFHAYDQSTSPLVRTLLGRKLEPLLRRVSAATCGNDYVADHARRFCDRVLVVPTVVDTDRYLPRAEPRTGVATIGWIGSPSTWSQVRPLLPLLADLHRTHGIRFRAIGAGTHAEADRFDGLDLVDWCEEEEIAEVQAMDIGIMPLTDSPFIRGKSGYKLIQYMACGLPTVASPIGVNASIVEDGRTGYLAAGEQEWRAALFRLIGDPDLRRRLGQQGRCKAVASYSLASQAPRIVDLFQSLASVRKA